MNQVSSPTIVAIATPPGAGAVSIIRLSGPESLVIMSRIFQPLGEPDKWRPREMRLGRVSDISGQLLDLALGVWFLAPHSFTGEEVCEIQGHGGQAVTGLVLAALLSAGAVLAQPGEFTRRAFSNGQLDLTAAEAVADLVAARSEAEANLAARQLAGGLAAKIRPPRQALLRGLARLTAELDFGDDLETFNPVEFKQSLHQKALVPLTDLWQSAQTGRPFRYGVRLVLAGAPNAGKSSLFNALAGQERALVSGQPGTTRDFITLPLTWGGVTVELCDTAGLSARPQDELDALGQDRTRNQLAEADLILWVNDSQTNPGDLALASPHPERTLVVWNKIDLAPTNAPLGVSAKTGQGLAELKQAVLSRATGQQDPRPPEIVPNLRHQAALKMAVTSLTEALDALDNGWPLDICALELKNALVALDFIGGVCTPEEVLSEIFSNFCLGK